MKSLSFCRKKHKTYIKKLQQIFKYCGSSVLIWRCIVIEDSSNLVFMDEIMEYSTKKKRKFKFS